MASLIAFLTPIIQAIVVPILKDQINELKEWMKENAIAAAKIGAISKEAGDLLGELENAQSESERKAILRKLNNFSDVSKLVLGLVHDTKGSAEGH